MFVYAHREDLHSGKWIISDTDLVPCLVVERTKQSAVVAYVVQVEGAGPVVRTDTIDKTCLIDVSLTTELH